MVHWVCSRYEGYFRVKSFDIRRGYNEYVLHVYRIYWRVVVFCNKLNRSILIPVQFLAVRHLRIAINITAEKTLMRDLAL